VNLPDSRILDNLNFHQGLRESANDSPHDFTATHELIEAMITGYTLLEFHSLPDPCEKTDTNEDVDQEEEDLYSSIGEDSEDEGTMGNSTKTDDDVGRHPFVKTR
jgi:hypothetical protein